MDLLIHIATPHSRGVLDHLAKACARSGIQWACFLTNDGVKLLEVQSIQKALSAADALIVCKHAWNLHLPKFFPLQISQELLSLDLLSMN